MTTPLRRRLRRVRRVLAYGVATLLVLAALAVAVANQLLPLLTRYPDDVAQWLSQRIGRPVQLQQVDARWSRGGPLLTVTGLRIGSGKDVLEIDDAELQINVYSGVLPGSPLTVLRLRGPALELARDADGRWQLEGLGEGRREGGFDLKQLDGIGELQVESADLALSDTASGRRWQLQQVDARMRNLGGRVRVGVSARIGDGAPLRVVADMDRTLEQGLAWFGGEAVQLAPWLGEAPVAGIELRSARGDLGVWLRIEQRAVTEVQVEARLVDIALRGVNPVALDDNDEIESRYGIDALDAALRWRSDARGWRIDSARLRLDAGDSRADMPQLQIWRDDSLHLVAREVELGPLLSVALLSDAPTSALRRFLYLAAPRGQVSSINLHWRDAEQFELDAQIGPLSWLPYPGVPAVEGLAGRLRADAGAMELQLTPQQWRISMPGTLREPLQPRVEGTIHAVALHPGWRVEASHLKLHEPDYAFTVGGGIEFQGDGSRPLLDLRAEVEPGPVTAAKRFWIMDRMPEAAVRWLDEALLEGQLQRGRIIVRGDADDWPFANDKGRLEAIAEISDVQLKFRPDWPAGDSVSGEARFINRSIELELSGRVLGNRIERVTGGIADLKKPILQLSIAGEGSGGELLRLLRESPLQHRYGEYLTGLAVGGKADVALQMQAPLKSTLGEFAMQGRADLVRADLSDAKWDLAFAGASGRVRFSERGFSADELNVGFAGGMGALSIAVGGYTSDSGRVAEASLRGRFDVDRLLQPYPALHWLQPHLNGTSDWSLLLTVPQSLTPESPRVLRVRSDLVGTALTLPAPLRKTAADRLQLDLSVGLPLVDGQIDLRLGRLLRLRGNIPEGGGFTGVAAFGGTPGVEPPASGLVVVGQVPVLDVGGWAAFAMTGGAGDGALESLDLFAGELDILERGFAETSVSFARADDGTLDLGFSGESLQGTVQVPVSDIAVRGITARFERLHWPTQAPDADANASTAAAQPALIPPLHLHIGDFRFGEAEFGSARLETYPTPEGLHIERFETTSSDLELRSSGDWTRIEGHERSSFRFDFSAPNLGAMLKALGFAELIEGGQTVAALDATWPGPPSAFALEKVEGNLNATVGKGRVLQVEPGAGRLFGLLSLTEIPRRLALDFSDFFKSGLAFNEISGSFTLDGGNAYTEDLRIDGPSAEIKVRGRTGLKAKDYDQTMEVLPRAGSVLPALGALAAGPAGAAIGAVAQAVLQKPMKQLGRSVYRVQGSWDEPKIEVIERGAEAGAGENPGHPSARRR